MCLVSETKLKEENTRVHAVSLQRQIALMLYLTQPADPFLGEIEKNPY